MEHSIALVTGTTSGVGYEAACLLATNGYRQVILTGRSLARVQETAAQLAAHRGTQGSELVRHQCAVYNFRMRAFYEWKVQLKGGALSLSRLAWILSFGTVFLASCGGPGTMLNARVAAPNISVLSATTDSLASPHLNWEVLDLTPSSSQPVLSPSGLFPGDFSTAVIGSHVFLVKLHAGSPQGVGNLTLGGSIREVQCGYFYTATSPGSAVPLRHAVPVGHPVSRLLEGDFQTEALGEMSTLAYIVVEFNSQMPPANNDRQICPMAYTGPLVSPELHMGVTFNGTLRLWGMASTRADAARRSTVWLTIQVLPE